MGICICKLINIAGYFVDRICDPWCFLLVFVGKKWHFWGKCFRGPQPLAGSLPLVPPDATHPGDKAIRPTATFEDLRSGKITVCHGKSTI